MCLFRQFLQELPSTAEKYKSRIKSNLEEADALDNFTSLASNTINWNITKETVKVLNTNLPFCDSPPSKRRKM